MTTMQKDFDELHKINIREENTRSNGARYIAEIEHWGIGTSRVLKDMEMCRLDNKVETQFVKWDEKCNKFGDLMSAEPSKLKITEGMTYYAKVRTHEAQKKQKRIDDLLTCTFDNVDLVDFDFPTENLFQKDIAAVVQYFEMVILCYQNNLQYPETFPTDFDLNYNPDNKILIVEYSLPAPNDLPTLTEVRYIATSGDIKELFLSETQISKKYDTAIYKVTLRTLYELFKADKAEALDAIIFNGWVNSINKATGKRVNNCIVTIQVKKTEFNEIELPNIDAKICFKHFKGVGSSKLSGITFYSIP